MSAVAKAVMIVITGVLVMIIVLIGITSSGISEGTKSILEVLLVFAYIVFLIWALIYGIKNGRRERKETGQYASSGGNAKRYVSSIPVDQMSGIDFERHCAALMRQRYGFVRVEMTKTSGDYGGDLVGYHRDGSKWVIQCKRYSSHVGVEAVQQVVSAKAVYNADRIAVMTNNVLTASAKELASKNGVVVYENIR